MRVVKTMGTSPVKGHRQVGASQLFVGASKPCSYTRDSWPALSGQGTESLGELPLLPVSVEQLGQCNQTNILERIRP